MSKCVCVLAHTHQRALASPQLKSCLSQGDRYTQIPTKAAIHLHVQTKQTLNTHMHTHPPAHAHRHKHTHTRLYGKAGNLGAGLL